MKIKRYPGKAVINDPVWLEMDIPNHARGQLYEANWLDTQQNLSNISSSSNSWDKYSTKSDGTVSSRLGQYQTLLEEIQKDTHEDLYAAPRKIKSTDSIRLKYHSDKILSKINNAKAGDSEDAEDTNQYFLPVPKPRAKLFHPENDQDKFKMVLEDLQRQIKKSVRFDDVSTDIDAEIERQEAQVRVIVNPTHELLEKISHGKEAETAADGRISEWVDMQNQYLTEEDIAAKVGKDLVRNDSGYYEHSKKIRQRIPPKHIYPSSSSSSDSKSDSNEEVKLENYQEMYSLYKEGVYVRNSLKEAPKRVDVGEPTSSYRRKDFAIPRPKLLVPVHTYAVRRRRTGNLNRKSSDYGTVSVSARKGAGSSEGKQSGVIQSVKAKSPIRKLTKAPTNRFIHCFFPIPAK